MRVIFLGTPQFAVPSLRILLDSCYDVSAVYTQPDRPAGRGRILHPPPVKVLAGSEGIPVFQPAKIRLTENQSALESFRPDFLAVVAYGQILPAWLLKLPRVAAVNVHGSLLPKYRGAAPIAWAIMNGEPITGVTTMMVEEKLDTGPILLQEAMPLPEQATTGEVTTVMSGLGARMLLETMDGMAAGTINPIPQDDELASFAPRITKELSPVSWLKKAPVIHDQIRALNPWPIADSDLRGTRVRFFQTRVEEKIFPQAAAAGTYLGTTENGIRIQCGGGTVLEILELQVPGKKRVSGKAFANGMRLKPGEALFHDRDSLNQ